MLSGMELAKYQAGAWPYNSNNEEKDTSAFVNAICGLVDSELRNWSALLTDNRSETDQKDDKHNPGDKTAATPSA